MNGEGQARGMPKPLFSFHFSTSQRAAWNNIGFVLCPCLTVRLCFSLFFLSHGNQGHSPAFISQGGWAGENAGCLQVKDRRQQNSAEGYLRPCIETWASLHKLSVPKLWPHLSHRSGFVGLGPAQSILRRAPCLVQCSETQETCV